MSYPILITGAAGGSQGSTGRLVAALLLKQSIPVRAFVHKLDARSDELRRQVRKSSRAISSAQPQSRRQ